MISFDSIIPGEAYTRPFLANKWKYQSFNALGRGIVTPTNTKFIILFITKIQQKVLTQYSDHFVGNTLHIEGETNHANDKRLINARGNGDNIHLFYREKHHSPFIYYGEIFLEKFEIKRDKPSEFIFETYKFKAIASNSLITENETHGYVGEKEGKRKVVIHYQYERSIKNRAKAIELHGTKCKVCGFDFNEIYGEDLARNYIEVHHVQSITEKVRVVNPEKDLIPLCSNCHSMVHRKRGEVISISKLKSFFNKNSN